MNEIWKDIKGYEGIYEVSNLGRVRSIPRNGTINKTKILSPALIHGYYSLCLRNKNKKMHRVSRLVAQAFIPNPENKPEVNHIDGNKKNNVVCNLEWNTASENMLHAFKTGLHNLEGERHPRSKLTQDQVECIKWLYNRHKIKQNVLAWIYKVGQDQISRIANEKRWVHLNKAKEVSGGER